MIRTLIAAAVSLLPLAASAEQDEMQELAEQNVAKLEELLVCVREMKAGAGVQVRLMESLTPRTFVVLGTEMRDDSVLVWQTFFEFVDDRFFVFDRHRPVDQSAQLQPGQIAMPSGFDMAVPETVQQALISCGASWMGYWQYEPVVPEFNAESLLPPLE